MSLPQSLKDEYTRLSPERDEALAVARECASFTLQALLPHEGEGRRRRRGYSNFGARCVNSLASSYVLAMLPARQAFFRMSVPDSALEQLQKKELRGEVEKALLQFEQELTDDIETTPTRAPLGEALKHAVVAGNVLLYDLPTGGLRVFPLSRYVVDRDGEGNLLSHICVEELSPETLPESIRAAVLAKIKGENGRDKTVSLYTGVFRQGNHWKVWQEVEGFKVPGSEGTYPRESSPWLAIRLIPTDGAYGRGLVEDYLNYFRSLEALTAALVKGTAVTAKVIYLVAPNGVTKKADLVKAQTGDVISGKDTDVTTLQTQKAMDLRVCREMIADIKEELSYAFSLKQAIQRNAERVTAEEIRYLAQDLDTLHGGSYSTLANEFQRPFLNSRRARLEKAGRLPRLPKGMVKPMIITGLDALGRGAELDSLRAFVKDVVDLGGPEALQTYINFEDLLTRLATARGMRTDGLMKSKDEIAQAMQQKNMQALVQHLGPNAVTQMGQLAKAGMPPATQ